MVMQVGKGGTQEDVDRFGRRLPRGNPAISVGAVDARLLDETKLAYILFDGAGQTHVALDEPARQGAAAKRFQANDASAGENIDKQPAGNGVAQDAEQRLAHHLRRGPQLWVDGTNDLSATQTAGHDASGGVHENRSQESGIRDQGSGIRSQGSASILRCLLLLAGPLQ